MRRVQTNQQLGYPSDARLLILNGDDFGMCHAINEAIIHLLESGLLTSTTLMTPCPWALEAMQYLASHPEVPFGVHLTTISEGVNYRWGPVKARRRVPSLVDKAGYFYSGERMSEFLAQVNLEQLDLEFRAQIEVVLSAGLTPTHLDWHSLRIGDREDIQNLMLRLAKEYGLALRVMGRNWIERVQGTGLPTIDHDFVDSYRFDPTTKTQRYAQMLRDLPPGLSEWAVHPGLDSAELRAVVQDGWRVRQTDYEFLVSQQARDLVEEAGIILLDYGPLQPFWRSANPS